MLHGLLIRSMLAVLIGYRIKFLMMMVVYVINKARHKIY